MVEYEIDKRAREVNIKAKSNKEFFLLHGYTGSPTDFNELGKYLNKRFNATVRIIRLKGHGEKIENIDRLEYKDFINQAEEELKKDLKKGRKIIIGGLSVGSLIALHLSAKYDVKGILNISMPYKNKFPVGLITFFEPVILKKHWKKPIPKYEKELRRNAFFYDINLKGLKIIKHAKKELKKVLKKIKAPCLIVHVSHDYIFHINGARFIIEKISSNIKDLKILKTEKKASHNPFFTPQNKELYNILGDFVEENKLFD
ncbi:MAG: hypothetical protein Q8N99_04240 [Nanoarchaeota archaeon]|nr:hypothetical protein [Nanoarchaeota archaeon]